MTSSEYTRWACDFSAAMAFLFSRHDPRLAAMTIASAISEIASHKLPHGEEFEAALTVAAEALGWNVTRNPLTRNPLPIYSAADKILMEAPLRDSLGQLLGELVPQERALRAFSAIAFDVDGTLRTCTVPGQPCPNKPGEWTLCPGVRNFFSWLHQQLPEMRLGVASNQMGVSHGYLDLHTAVSMIYDTIDATGRGHDDWEVQIAISPDPGSPDRKPNAGMLERLSRLWEIHPNLCLFVGDMESDRQAACNAGWWYLDAQQLFPRWA